MLELFNNVWVLIISSLLLYLIIINIINLFNPFDFDNYIMNYQKKKKINNNVNVNVNDIILYYFGL